MHGLRTSDLDEDISLGYIYPWNNNNAEEASKDCGSRRSSYTAGETGSSHITEGMAPEGHQQAQRANRPTWIPEEHS